MTDISSSEYRTIKGQNQSQFEEEKSVFITSISHVESEDEAKDFIEEISQKYKDATHNCTAYIINEIPVIKRYDDNGEPTGTAGLPMLSVLEKNNLTNVGVVVTRYFGGKLLGKGGLVRAYSRGVSDVIDGNIVYKRPFYVVELIHSYNVLGQIENYLNENKIKIIGKDFTDMVKQSAYISVESFEKIEKDLTNLTSGQINIKKEEVKMLFTK